MRENWNNKKTIKVKAIRNGVIAIEIFSKKDHHLNCKNEKNKNFISLILTNRKWHTQSEKCHSSRALSHTHSLPSMLSHHFIKFNFILHVMQSQHKIMLWPAASVSHSIFIYYFLLLFCTNFIFCTRKKETQRTQNNGKLVHVFCEWKTVCMGLSITQHRIFISSLCVIPFFGCIFYVQINWYTRHALTF